MHKHKNKSHRMQLIDLCAEILAYQEFVDWGDDVGKEIIDE